MGNDFFAAQALRDPDRRVAELLELSGGTRLVVRTQALEGKAPGVERPQQVGEPAPAVPAKAGGWRNWIGVFVHPAMFANISLAQVLLAAIFVHQSALQVVQDRWAWRVVQEHEPEGASYQQHGHP